MAVDPDPTLLSDEHRRLLRESGRRQIFGPGEVLFVEGDPADYAALIDRGAIKVTQVAPTGYTSLLAVRGAGELVGEFGCLDDEPRSGTVTAVTPVAAYLIGASQFRKLVAEHPRLVLELLKIAVGRARESDRRRLEFGAYLAVTRIGRALLEMARRHGRPVPGSPGAVAVPTLQRDLAGAASSSRESVARTLRKLQEGGVVETGRGQIVVNNLDLLAELVDQAE